MGRNRLDSKLCQNLFLLRERERKREREETEVKLCGWLFIILVYKFSIAHFYQLNVVYIVLTIKN